jgi:hypothetical protein
MKNRYILILFFFFLQNLSAQNVQWFAPGAHWEYFYLTNGSTGFSSMYIDSTLIIGGENCFKLTGYDRGHDYINNQDLNVEIPPIYAFSRNDSVFLWSSDHFEVLYDFTRQVGDSMSLEIFYDYAILEETGDTILWNGINTRYQKWEKYNVNFSETSYIFEGLGGESFNYWKFISPGAELSSKITCYRDDAHPLPTCDFTYTPDYQTLVLEKKSGGVKILKPLILAQMNFLINSTTLLSFWGFWNKIFLIKKFGLRASILIYKHCQYLLNLISLKINELYYMILIYKQEIHCIGCLLITYFHTMIPCFCPLVNGEKHIIFKIILEL